MEITYQMTIDVLRKLGDAPDSEPSFKDVQQMKAALEAVFAMQNTNNAQSIFDSFPPERPLLDEAKEKQAVKEKEPQKQTLVRFVGEKSKNQESIWITDLLFWISEYLEQK